MTEIYTIYKIDEIDYYKCINCDFYTKYLWSINRHSKNNNCINDIIYCEYCKKEFKYESEKEKHLNRKKKCYIECETLIEKQINKKNDKNINELKDENEKLLNDNKLLKNQIINDEKRIAIKAAKAMNLKVAGVDIIRSSKGPLLLEVNSSPGLEGIETATHFDIAGKIIEYIEHNVKKPVKRIQKDKVNA